MIGRITMLAAAVFAALAAGIAFDDTQQASAQTVTVTEVGSLQDPEIQYFDRAAVRLDGAAGVDIFKTNNKIYAVVASAFDDGIQILDITDPSNPLIVSTLGDWNIKTPHQNRSDRHLDGAIDVEVLEIGTGKFFAAVVSYRDNALQIINVTDPNHPAITDGNHIIGTGALSGVTNVAVAHDGTDYFAVVTHSNGAVRQVITSSGILSNTNQWDDGTTTMLAKASGVDIAQIGGSWYIVVGATDGKIDRFCGIAGQSRTKCYDMERFGGFQIINLSTGSYGTALENKFVCDGNNNNCGYNNEYLFNIVDVKVIEIASKHYIVAVTGDLGYMRIIDISDPANPSNVSKFFPSGGKEGGFGGVQVATLGSKSYAVLTNPMFDKAYLIDITDPARPSTVHTINIDGAFEAAFFQTPNNAHYLLVTGGNFDGIKIYRLGGTGLLMSAQQTEPEQAPGQGTQVQPEAQSEQPPEAPVPAPTPDPEPEAPQAIQRPDESEPQPAPEQPQSAPEQPQSAPEQPQSAPEQPQSAPEQPQSAPEPEPEPAPPAEEPVEQPQVSDEPATEPELEEDPTKRNPADAVRRYDTNNSGAIENDEWLKAIDDYTNMILSTAEIKAIAAARA